MALQPHLLMILRPGQGRHGMPLQKRRKTAYLAVKAVSAWGLVGQDRRAVLVADQDAVAAAVLEVWEAAGDALVEPPPESRCAHTGRESERTMSEKKTKTAT